MSGDPLIAADAWELVNPRASTGLIDSSDPRTTAYDVFHIGWASYPQRATSAWTTESRHDDPDPNEVMKARIPPESAIPGCGELGRYRFRAHFDDPASAECRTTEALPAGEVVLDARLSELLCRSELVLDAAVAIGRAP